MMNEVDMSGWTDLIHSSTKLLEHAPPVQFPPLQRNLDQLEALSKKLKVKTLGNEIPTESIAAARLLAREGINAEHLSRDLKSSFEIKAAPEDAFPSKAATVDEYLQQAMMSAIEEAQKDNLRSFNNYMMKVSEEDWQKEKRDFLQSFSRISVLPRKNYVKDGQQEVVPVSSFSPTSQPRGTEGGALPDKSVTQRKAAVYLEVVKRHNYSRERDLLFKPATIFRSAYEGLGLEPASGKSVTMHKIWCLVQSLVEGDGHLQKISKKMQLVVGARRHLELGHEKYITDTIHNHPSQAMLGGALGNLQKIHAFLRVRLRDYGPLDFDAQDAHRRPPVDTTWQQIYFCLRTGYYNEAKKVASSSRASRDFSAMLNAWVLTGGSAVPVETATAASGECDRMWSTADRGGRVSYDKKRLLLYALLSGSRRQIDRILRELPNMFSTIEDFLWFNSASVRDDTAASPSTTDDPPCYYCLEDLQSHLNKFDPSHYTKSGKDPLVYPYVLLLTIQLLPALLFMAKQEGCNPDTAHIAIALASHAAFSPPSAVTEVSHMIRQYGSEYLRVGNPAAALEYYAESAAAIGGAAFERQKNLMLTQLLTELLLRDGGVLLLLGSTGSGEDGELVRFLPDARKRRQFLLEASQHCVGAGLDERSVEIQKRVGAFSDALDTVNRCLSAAVCALSRGALDGDSRIAALLRSGNDVIDTFRRCHGDVGAREWDRVGEQQTVLRQLEAILSVHQLAQVGRHADALVEISRLPFLHVDDAMQALSPHVLSCIPSVLRVALTCLESKGLPDSGGSPFPAMRAKIANILANNMHRNWPRDLYEIVARSL